MEEVHYGKPAAEALGGLVSARGAERVFLMASGTLNRETDEVEKVRRALGNKCIGTFDRMPAHSPRSAIVAAANQAREGKADLIVTLGGGSITDGAKAVQLCLANDVSTVDGMDRIRGNAVVKPPTVRQISVPTTLSAGEFSALAGVTNEATKVKEMYRHPLTIPRAVILDPEVTRHTPMWLFLSTGIRAVDHCVEGVCSNESTEFSNATSLHALSLLTRGLRRGKGDPPHMKARAHCQQRALPSQGGFGAGAAVGGRPRLGHVAGAGFRLPHCHTSCPNVPAGCCVETPAQSWA
ncbi:MAG: iron-containing alcohol dehydrogenase, partial [Reyranella sp.]|nr:iron-containing alcohol dehydrogenase [Reyranella sp.]